MKLNSYYKLTTSALVIILAFSFLFFSFTPQTHAAWGFGDISTDPGVSGTTGATAGTSASSAGTNAADLAKEFALDIVAYTVAQELANYLVSKFTTWVNNGFDGNPFYVPDQKSFMKEFQDTEIIKMYESFEDGYNSATDKQVILGILENEKQSLTQKLTPTLSDTQRQEFSNDFSKGGWDTWDELIKPVNNVLGRKKIIAQEYTKRVTESQNSAQQELLQGEGYLPKKECATVGDLQDQYSTDPDEEEDVDDDLCPTGSIWQSSTNSCVPFDGSADQTYGQSLGQSFNVELQNFSYDPNCERWETQTPGKLISSSINRASDQQFESLSRADEFSEIASAALGAMVDAMVNKGLSELKSSADNAFSSSNRNSVSGIEYLGNETTGYTAPDGQVDWLNTQTTVVDLELELPRAIANAGTALYFAQKTVDEQSKFLRKIQLLDFLLPGPDVGYTRRMTDGFNQATKEESLYLMRKDDAAEGRINRFNLLKRTFQEGLAKLQENITDPRYFAYPISQQSRILEHIGSIADYGRENKTSRQQLSDLRRTYFSLLAIKEEIMGGSYNPGRYDPELDAWVDDTWFTPEEWDAWRNEGVDENGEIELTTAGNPVDDVQTRETLRRRFLSLEQDVPQAGILSRISNETTRASRIVEELDELLIFSEEFWASNYRMTVSGNEDFAYWKDFYSEFTRYITTDPQDFSGQYQPGSQLDSIDSATTSRFGRLVRKIDYPGPNGHNKPGGPWEHLQPRNFPPNWLDLPRHQLELGNSRLLQIINSPNYEPGDVAEVLLATQDQNFGQLTINTIKRRAVKPYSMLVAERPWNTEPWNILRRDREERLFCPFYGNIVTNNSANDSIKRYRGFFCSDGWYHATYVDYLKEYDIDFATATAQSSF